MASEIPPCHFNKEVALPVQPALHLQLVRHASFICVCNPLPVTDTRELTLHVDSALSEEATWILAYCSNKPASVKDRTGLVAALSCLSSLLLLCLLLGVWASDNCSRLFSIRCHFRDRRHETERDILKCWMDRPWGQTRPTTLSSKVSACVTVCCKYLLVHIYVLRGSKARDSANGFVPDIVVFSFLINPTISRSKRYTFWINHLLQFAALR